MGVEPSGIYEGLSLPERNSKDAGLPFAFMNAVVSVDGSAALGGRAGGIGGGTDREVMRVLRSHADAVLVGANTLRAERMSLSSEGRRSPEPLAVILTSTGDVPLENLLNMDAARTVVAVPRNVGKAKIGKLSGRVRILRIAESPPLRPLLHTLRSDFGVSRVLIEGGPSLFGEAISSGLVEELFLTISPKIALESPAAFRRLVETPNGYPPVELHLISVHESAGELFLHYRIRH
ncbi:RibD family protein [Rubrobacter xylanophilus]|uniref:RibD family protein n=1 Tax=Rubrobacter xylanophilus TaxID=49319 RepID=UPI001C6406FA|nr:RibD family protein [Rubrobacter xylanophilus]